MSDIEISSGVSEDLFRNKENRELILALMISGGDPVYGYETQNFETNTNSPMVGAQFPNNKRNTCCQIMCTVGNSTSLANGGLTGTIANLNRVLFGEKEQNYFQLDQSPKTFVEKYVNGVMEYFNYDLNTFKQQKVPRMVETLKAHAQLLNRLDQTALAGEIDKLVTLVQDVANELGSKSKKEEAPKAEAAGAEAEVLAEPASEAHNVNPIS